MTKEEFEQGYIERSKITREFYDKHMITLPCNCGAENCKGFAAVGNNEQTIKMHMELYAHE